MFENIERKKGEGKKFQVDPAMREDPGCVFTEPGLMRIGQEQKPEQDRVLPARPESET